MRILMLAQFYPPIIGGEERHVRNLSIELAARGHHVAVATLWHEGMAEVEVEQGVRIYRIRGSMQRAARLFSEEGRQHAPPFPDPEVVWALQGIIRRERPAIIHAHNWIVHSFLPLKAWSRAKLVVTLHDYSLLCAIKRLMYQNAICIGPGLRKCLACAGAHYGRAKGSGTTLGNALSGALEQRMVDMFLPVSQAVAEGTQLAQHKLAYRVIPNFVPDTLEAADDATHPLLEQLPQENYLLFVGDIVRDKGVEVLFEAYNEMHNTIPLVLIGRPGERLSIDTPENTVNLRSWPHEAVMGAWRRCTIGLAPSIWADPCPTVAMEAMAMGRPVIASRIGGLADIISDGQTGFLVTPGDPRALRAAIQCLLDDPARREHMGYLAKQRVAQFQARTVVPRIEQVYEEVQRQ
ncbi:MAG: glycosyltransferase family 4 protein [Chloroflexota bacterium]|nr:glycosyltransferase family 4 protein [Chloroflexota bacterium]